MSDTVKDGAARFDCERARRMIHLELDGDAPTAVDGAWCASHLESCGDCRDFRRGMQAIQESLRGMPHLSFPDDALDRILGQTVDAPPGTVSRETSSTGATDPAPSTRRWRPDWRSAAVAAVLVAAAFGLWEWSRPPATVEPPSTLGMIVIDPERVRDDPEYARRIAEETRRVLALTSGALRRTEQAVLEDVGQELTERLRLPFATPAPTTDEGGTEDENVDRNRRERSET